MARSPGRGAVLLVLAVCGCQPAALQAAARVGPPVAGRPLCRELGAVAPVDRAACDKDWSVLVYMMADAPGLTPYALWNLHQMEGRLPDPAAPGSAASGRDADVVVELDVDQPPGIRRLQVQGGLTEFVPLRAADGAAAPGPEPRVPVLASPVVEAIDEASAEAPPATLATNLSDFLSWGIAHYPARHYAVIVWGHGFGFRPAGASASDGDTPRGGIALDVSRHAVLDTPSLREALARTSAARLGGRPFDLYLSDACLMQTIEVGAELAGVVRYVGGAEAKLAPVGLPYRLLVPRLNGSAPPPPASPRCAAQDAACRFAVVLPALVQRGLAPESELYGAPELSAEARDNLTYSVVDAERLASGVVPAMHGLGAALLAYLREAPHQADRARALRDLLLPHRPSAVRPPFAYAFPGGGRDIGSLLFLLRARLSGEAERTAQGLSPAAASLLRAVDDTEAAVRGAVLASALGSRYADPEYSGMLGVSVWLPIDAGDHAAHARWFAAARSYRAPDGTTGTASPWGAWLRELFPI
jgi:hypothetical protein